MMDTMMMDTMTMDTMPTTMVEVSGTFRTQSGAPVPSVTVSVTGDQTGQVPGQNDGTYSFIAPTQLDYTITPSSDDESGSTIFSVLDPLLFQQHLDGMTSFTSPVTYLAADINDDGQLDNDDLDLLMMIIMGVLDDTAQVEVWRFVPSDFEFDTIPPFSTSGSVFNHPRSVDINPLTADTIVDFVAVRVGDINNSFSPPNSARPRSAQEIISITDRVLFQGDIIEVPISHEISDLSIASLAMNYNTEALEMISADHLLVNLDGRTVIGNADVNDELITTMKFRVLRDGKLSDFLALDVNESLSVVRYEDNSDATLRLQYQEAETSLRVETISPNPFSDFSVIRVHSDNQGSAQVHYYNANGQIVAQQEINLISGMNEIRITNEDLGGNTGLIHFVIRAEDTAQRGKLLLIR